MQEHTFFEHVTGAVVDYLFQEFQIRPDINYKVASATSGPRVLTLGLVINPRYAIKVMKMSEPLSMVASLDRESKIRAARGHRGTLTLEIPKPRHLWYNIGTDSLPRCRSLKAPVGIDGDHRPARVDFADPLTPHLLTAGTTGSGKTNTARLFISLLAQGNPPDRVKMILVDTRKRGTAWRPFSELPHLLHPIVTDDAEALRALGWAVAELDRRSVDGVNSPRVFIAIDEAQSLLDRDEFIKPVSDLAAVGREFGIHLLLATQRPTSQMMGNAALKQNLTTRIVGKMDSAQSAQVAAGVKGSGAELLLSAGDQLLIQPGTTKRITTALLSTKDTDRLPRASSIPELDLGDYDDIDHVLDQANNKATPLVPAHIALALTTKRGINWLSRQLGIGGKKATRVKNFAAELDAALEGLEYSIIPHSAIEHGRGVTESRSS